MLQSLHHLLQSFVMRLVGYISVMMLTVSGDYVKTARLLLTRFEAEASANDSPLGRMRMWSCSLLTRHCHENQPGERGEWCSSNCFRSCRGGGGSYRQVRVAKVGPAEQVDQSVEAGQLAARQLFPLHHGGVFCPVHVVDGRDHAQTWRGTG